MHTTIFSRSARRLAIAGVTSLAMVSAVAPTAALAEDDLAPLEGDMTTSDVGDEATDSSEKESGTGETDQTDGTGQPDGPDETDEIDGPDETDEIDEIDGPDETDEESPKEEVKDTEAEEERGVSIQAEEDELEEPILPDYGFGKSSQPIRVGVELAEGTYVPDSVTTVGSTLEITETGPSVEGGTVTTECTTEASTATADSSATFCVFDNEPTDTVVPLGVEESLPSDMVELFSTVEPESPNDAEDDQVYLAETDSTVTIVQTSAPEGLVLDPEPAVVTPDCNTIAIEDGLDISFDCVRQVALFQDTGLPPIAVDDEAVTDEGTPVDIDVLANDDPVAGAPITDVQITSDPSDGTAEITGSGADAEIEYTPADGFLGEDVLEYAYSTPNGTASATVTILVEGQPVSEETDETDETDEAPTAAVTAGLPYAGGVDARLIGLGALLLAGGGILLARGRRRESQPG